MHQPPSDLISRAPELDPSGKYVFAAAVFGSLVAAVAVAVWRRLRR